MEMSPETSGGRSDVCALGDRVYIVMIQLWSPSFFTLYLYLENLFP
jgi:hypothetical protein